MTLHLGWCDAKAARFAVEHWHYSKRMPATPYAAIGVWEHGEFIGCVLFSRGSTNHIGSPYGLRQTEICELTRVALRAHTAPVTRIISIALRMLKAQSPGLRLVVSYADPHQGHTGRIYQAGNWIYAGQTPPMDMYVDEKGREHHPRVVSPTGYKKQFGVYKKVRKPVDLRRERRPGKYRYLMPLDRGMRQRIESLRRPHPATLTSPDQRSEAV